MRRRNLAALSGFAAALLMSVAFTASGQTQNDSNIANVVGGGAAIRWEVSAANTGGTLTITFPDGRAVRKTVKAGASPQIGIGEKYFENLPDGIYTYELQLAPVMSTAQRDALQKARGKDDDPENERAARKRVAMPGLVQSGSFAVVNGAIVTAGATEPEAARPKAAAKPLQTFFGSRVRGTRSNHFSLFPDVVTADDSIIQGSECVGLDCVNNESFSFDTIRLKENNTRITFMDTSTSAGFPSEDWTIRANDSGSGGGNFLGFVDKGTTSNGDESGTIIFRVDAGAPVNSLRVSSTGNVGIGTATPVLDIHDNATDTPAIRLEQNNTGGFTAQTWDVAGNEANFFVRDVTSGSRLPFRIRPGAPTSSIDIAASGNVGIGTASPSGKLQILSSSPDRNTNTQLIISDSTNNLKQLRVGWNATSDFAYMQSTVFGTSANNLILNEAGGNVGIGTTSPTALLSVNGTANKPGGGSWDVFSDERLKNIKGRFNTGLKAVMQLQPIRYEYKPDNALHLKSTGENIGFGAQELQKIIPEAVKANANGYLTVNNDPILWTMLNAIKEQQKQIEELKAQVRRLRATRTRRR